MRSSRTARLLRNSHDMYIYIYVCVFIYLFVYLFTIFIYYSLVMFKCIYNCIYIYTSLYKYEIVHTKLWNTLPVQPSLGRGSTAPRTLWWGPCWIWMELANGNGINNTSWLEQSLRWRLVDRQATAQQTLWWILPVRVLPWQHYKHVARWRLKPSHQARLPGANICLNSC